MAKDSDPDGYPEPTLMDYAIEVTKGVVGSLVPGASGLAALAKTSHARKMEAFLPSLDDRVRAVEQFDTRCLLARAVDGDQDAQDEVVSILSKIGRLVDEANNDEKREMLAAALVSSFTRTEDADEMERHLFLRCLSDFEPIHVQLLDRARSGVVPVRELVNEEGVRGEIAQSVWSELYQRKMVRIDLVDGKLPGGGAATKTTPQGMRFLRSVGWTPSKP